jgi:hypothetical protein
MGIVAAGAGSLFPSHPVAAASDAPIRPLHIDVPEEALTDLRRRINETKWPERERCDAGRAACDDPDARSVLGDGLRLAQDRSETECPAELHDWIDGLDIHYIHVRSKHENALPLSPETTSLRTSRSTG